MTDPIPRSQLDQWATILRQHGYKVTKPDPCATEFTPAELCQFFNLANATLHKRLEHHLRPACVIRRGPKGRILSVGVTKELEAYLSRPVMTPRESAALSHAYR